MGVGRNPSVYGQDILLAVVVVIKKGRPPEPAKRVGICSLRDVSKMSFPIVYEQRVALHHLGEVDKRLKQLRALKKELKDMIVSCAGGEVATCTIMESITKATR